MTTLTTPTLRERLDEYLAMRRALGFQLNELERQVGLFCTWLEAQGQTQTFTIDDAVRWARLNPDAHPSWWATRLSLVRRFAGYLNANGVDVPVIPSGLLPARKPRAVPFIYTQNDIDVLLVACDTEFADERIAATLRTIIGLLAVTGLVGILDGFAFGLGVCAGIDLGGGHVGVAEQIADVDQVDAGLDQVHRSGASQRVGGDR